MIDAKTIGESLHNHKFNTGYTTELQTKYTNLVQAEEYFLRQVKKLDIEHSYDVTASEKLYFKTINYSTFAGFLMMHPLCPEQSMRQMQDAYADRLPSSGHIDYIRNKIKNDGTYTKYTFKDAKEEEYKPVIVILPGENKLYKHCCIGKLEYIINKHGRDNILFKKHPISYDKGYEALNEKLGGINFASAYSDMFKLIDNAEYVYTTMISESALTAYIQNKKVDHFDLYQNRHLASFIHINYYLFSEPDPVGWADTTFSSYKSGIVCPAIDTNWKDKIDHYLDYIMQLRSYYKNSYILR
jgi:hypothetical protein